MFKIEWDKNTGGVILSSKTTPNTLGISPRPVFWEELKMLRLDEDYNWTFPEVNAPLLWACNKQYYYRGELVFEVKGANVYDSATVILQPNAHKLTLNPVNVDAMLAACKDEMFLIESEAIEFIRSVYLQYSSARKSIDEVKANQIDFEALLDKVERKDKRQMAIVKQDCDSFDIEPLEEVKASGKKIYHTTRIDKFLASFSGGKDSQVVLDLCTRAIPPSEFEVIYSDTGYELPTSLSLYEETIRLYKERFPDLKFTTARNHESVLHYWDKIGTPSDTHRWCCAVMKTAPLYRSLKIRDTNKQAKILTFDGVRAEESTRRSGYSRIGKGVKHNTVINASPILNWNTAEIFLYLFKYKLQINQSYRQGMTRVGCLICPFSSEWNDMVSNKCYKSQLTPFLSRVEKITKESGVVDYEDYIKFGKWKRRGGGRGISFPSYLEVSSVKPNLQIKCISPQKHPLTWLSTVAEYNMNGNNGELKFGKDIFRFNISIKDDNSIITFENTAKSPSLQALIKRALLKATYCINCEACEVECPTGALSILPDVSIDRKKCTHCHKCLNFHDLGCIVASSLNISSNNKNNMKLISYNNFGLRESWFDIFITSYNTYFEDNIHGLNIKEQMPNFMKWLQQAEIIDDTKTRKPTVLCNLLGGIYQDSSEIVWEVIWINLSLNAPIAKWYKENVDWHFSFTEADIREMVKTDYPSDSPTTIKNIVYALFRTFKESPIGEMGLLTETEKLKFKKIPCENLSREAIAYSLYKYSEVTGIKSFRVADLYDTECKLGVYREFGISKTYFEKQLRSLNSSENRVLFADLNTGLDHITLRDDLTSIDVLNLLTK